MEGGTDARQELHTVLSTHRSRCNSVLGRNVGLDFFKVPTETSVFFLCIFEARIVSEIPPQDSREGMIMIGDICTGLIIYEEKVQIWFYISIIKYKTNCGES